MVGIHGNTWEYVGIRVFPVLFGATGNTWQTVWECPGSHPSSLHLGPLQSALRTRVCEAYMICVWFGLPAEINIY